MTQPHPSAPCAAIHSVGCKLNQYEAQLLRQQLEARGYRVVDFSDLADVYVVVSCTVTHRSDRECRRLARGARRRNPAALIVITGCYAEVAAEDLAARELADLIVSNRDKAQIPDLIDAARGREAIPPSTFPEAPLLSEFQGHTRAFVKIQEGCSGGCTYCLISRARGPEQSVPPAQVQAQVSLLAQRHREIVLIGTHLGRYGRDLPEPVGLATLVENLCALPELVRLRLSSLEPLELSPGLRDLVAAGGFCLSPDPARLGGGKVCRHLHLPLQSGADTVLERMGRPYGAAEYAEIIEEMHRRAPGCALGADVIVGFPGETEAEFAATRDLLESLPLSYLHVFTFSARSGTPASDMPQQVPEALRQARNRVLRELSERKREAFAASQVGERLEVVIEHTEPTGELRGLADNYLQVRLPAAEASPGDLKAVQATGACHETLVAELT
ncbi:MAG TPA: tRNA (N(6)-L-threonylcarbamoyladenosine(37)-C(2))-methylthiotransferase MtaB [Armatimonadota bacterium]|jgi:threonylcarbamoyladenosine tRNA methylthiotransferase MtaB